MFKNYREYNTYPGVDKGVDFISISLEKYAPYLKGPFSSICKSE